MRTEQDDSAALRGQLKGSVARFDWRTFFKAASDIDPAIVAAMDEYFPQFAQPPGAIADDGMYQVSDGHPCLKCGEQLQGSMVQQLIGKGGFTWGLAHGAGHCKECGWPARLYHFLTDKDGKEVLTLRNVLLQVHPDFVTSKPSARR